MRAGTAVPWAVWATPGAGPEFCFTAFRRGRLARLAHRLRGHLTNEHRKGGPSC